MPGPPLPHLELPQDTDPEALKALRAAGAAPSSTDLIEALRRAEEAAARAALGPAPTREYTVHDEDIPDSGEMRPFGRITEPGAISYISLIVISDAALGRTQARYAIRLLPGINTTTPTLPAGTDALATPIWDSALGQFPDRDGFQFQWIIGPNQVIDKHYPLHFPIPIVPATLLVRSDIADVLAPGPAISWHLTVIVSSGIPAIPNIRFAPSFGRINLNLNTQPPPPRTARAPVPRAAALTVTQGGRILSERIVAWESLQPALRADWFNRQVGGTGDPNIRWIP